MLRYENGLGGGQGIQEGIKRGFKGVKEIVLEGGKGSRD